MSGESKVMIAANPLIIQAAIVTLGRRNPRIQTHHREIICGSDSCVRFLLLLLRLVGRHDNKAGLKEKTPDVIDEEVVHPFLYRLSP